MSSLKISSLCSILRKPNPLKSSSLWLIVFFFPLDVRPLIWNRADSDSVIGEWGLRVSEWEQYWIWSTVMGLKSIQIKRELWLIGNEWIGGDGFFKNSHLLKCFTCLSILSLSGDSNSVVVGLWIESTFKDSQNRSEIEQN